jgi:hypothetical protein
MGLLDGKPATNRKEPDRLEASNFGKVPIDRLAEIAPACRISRARVVDAGRIITAGGIASGMEMGFHLSGAPATTRHSSQRSPASWNTRPPTSCTAMM